MLALGGVRRFDLQIQNLQVYAFKNTTAGTLADVALCG